MQLLRLSDLYQYYWTVFRVFPCDVFSPSWISHENEILQLIGKLRKLSFRGRNVVGVDVERVSIWDKICSNTPTHLNHVNGSFARYITVANPYGLVAIIDCKTVSQRAFSYFQEFLFDPQTLVVMFAASDDLWSMHLTYGDILKDTPSKAPFPTGLKERGIFGSLKVIDIKTLFDAVVLKQPKNRLLWEMAGICPCKRGLWSLGIAFLGLDLCQYDLKIDNLDWATYWNRELTVNAIKYMTLDPLVTVHVFMAMFRLNLIPDISNEFNIQSVDFRPIGNLYQIGLEIFYSLNEDELSFFIENEIDYLFGFIDGNCSNNVTACFSGYIHDEGVLTFQKPNYENFSRTKTLSLLSSAENVGFRYLAYIKHSIDSTRPIFCTDLYFLEYNFSVHTDLESSVESYTKLENYSECPWIGFLTFSKFESFKFNSNSMVSSLTRQIENLELTDSSENFKCSNTKIDISCSAPTISLTSTTVDLVQLISERSTYMATAQQLQQQLDRADRESKEKSARISVLEREVVELRAQLNQRADSASRHGESSFGGFQKQYHKRPYDTRRYSSSKISRSSSGSRRPVESSPTKVSDGTKKLVDLSDKSSEPKELSSTILLEDEKLTGQFGADGMQHPDYLRSRDTYLAAIKAYPEVGTTRVTENWRNFLSKRYTIWCDTLTQEKADHCLLYGLQFLVLHTFRRPTNFPLSDAKLKHALHIATQVRDAMRKILAKSPLMRNCQRSDDETQSKTLNSDEPKVICEPMDVASTSTKID